MTSTAEFVSSLTSMSDSGKRTFSRRLWAEVLRRPEQTPPDGTGWVWYVVGGRGSGKTRAGSEGLAELVIRTIEAGDGDEAGDWAVVAPTFGDARDTCVEGPSGLRSALAGWTDGPWHKAWNRSQGQLKLANGATLFADGADDGAPRIQGKNLRGCWADEVGLWRDWDTAWNESIAFAVRLAPGCIVATGTPKAGHGLVKLLLAGDPTAGVKPAADHVTRMRMVDNIANLAPQMVERLRARYEGTTLGRQELEGEFITEVAGALWRSQMIEADRLRWPVGSVDERWRWANLRRVVVGVDPPGGATEAGIVVAGITYSCPCGGERMPHALVMDDCSTPGSPDEWGRAVVDGYRRWEADRIVAEVNYGGDMVEKVVRSVDARASYKPVRATRGKAIRAEPIAALYEQRRVHHVGTFPDLESEMTTWRPGDGWSPNRLDALVWAITDLEVEAEAQPARLHGQALAGLSVPHAI